MLPEELEDWLLSMGEPTYRAEQILRWIHRKGVLTPEGMKNVPAALRDRLGEDFPSLGAQVTQVATSSDGTRKLLLAFDRGGAVETVLIPDGEKLTQCLSTQVGCAFRCRFCLSGSRGLSRSLDAAEILAQVHLARSAYLGGERLSNIVLMGSGEPLANQKEVFRAIKLLIGSRGLDLSSRRVTLSTIGLPKGIRRLGEEFQGQIGLALSLHGPDDETRSKLLPKIDAVPIDSVLAALRDYPLPKRRRITIEYTLVKGINDSPRQADALYRCLRGIKVKLNLIPFNAHSASELQAPSARDIEAFQQVLIDRGMTAIIRKERGADIGAACGQLVAASCRSRG